MEKDKQPLVLKCCICGRIRGKSGWEFRFLLPDEGQRVSHGFCEECCENELLKMQWEANSMEAAANH